jgi:hypothetical protein
MVIAEDIYAHEVAMKNTIASTPEKRQEKSRRLYFFAAVAGTFKLPYRLNIVMKLSTQLCVSLDVSETLLVFKCCASFCNKWTYGVRAMFAGTSRRLIDTGGMDNSTQ